MQRAHHQMSEFLTDFASRFPYQVKVLTPARRAAREIMTRWCLGKPYRVWPSPPQAGEIALWCFMTPDDADFFQATFGGKLTKVKNAAPALNTRKWWHFRR